MSTLEGLTPGARLHGLLPGRAVTIVAVEWHGTSAIAVTYRDEAGQPANELLFRDDEARLIVEEPGVAWSFDGDPDLFKLVSEAVRIRLAYLFDPYLAVSTSRLESLPHQITAVYGELLPRQPLRYCLADDPGSGKTIMAGLFMTATPHSGKEEDFQLFMALLDADRFEGRFRDGVHTADVGDLMRRLVKEELSNKKGRRRIPSATSPCLQRRDGQQGAKR